MSGWQHFLHPADLGVHGFGATLNEAFAQAALAMTAAINDPASLKQEAVVEVFCTAPDRELLPVDWLNTWVYEMATRHMLFSRFQVMLANGGLRGLGWGETLNVERHHPALEIRDAT